MDTCIFRTCHRPLSSSSRVVCVEHQAEVDAEEAKLRRRRVLVYGSRTWDDDSAIQHAIATLPDDAVVIHGGARGADEMAGRAARKRGLAVEVFRADWGRHGRAAGPIRNQLMLDEGRPTDAIGFRMPGTSAGTDDMSRRLDAAGISRALYEALPPNLTAIDPNRCPHCGCGSIARTYPWSARVYRCQRPDCGSTFCAAD